MKAQNPKPILTFVIPGDLQAPTGGSRYDREVLKRLDACGLVARPIIVSARYPFPSEADRQDTAALLASANSDCMLIDGLAFGAFSEPELRALSKPCCVLLHHPLADETGLTAAVSEAFYAQEKANLVHATAVIVTSLATKALLVSRYDVPAERITVAEPAITKHDFRAAQSREPVNRPCAMLAVGSLSPRKNYALLVMALHQMSSNRAWTLRIAGRHDNRAETDRLKTLIHDCGLQHQIELLGSVSDQDLARLYQESDFLLFPSLYEGFGMVLQEALASSLPVLASKNIPSAKAYESEAVVLLDPAAISHWTKAIQQWINQSDDFTKAVKAAKQWSFILPDWDHTAKQVADVIKRVISLEQGSS